VYGSGLVGLRTETVLPLFN